MLLRLLPDFAPDGQEIVSKEIPRFLLKISEGEWPVVQFGQPASVFSNVVRGLFREGLILAHFPMKGRTATSLLEDMHQGNLLLR
ncbi:hypothetical protein D3C81_2216800 [compost metagenome]